MSLGKIIKSKKQTLNMKHGLCPMHKTCASYLKFDYTCESSRALSYRNGMEHPSCYHKLKE